MKRKLISRNKLQLTKKFNLPRNVQVLMYGDKQKFNESNRNKTRRVQVLDYENAFRFFGRDRVAVPILTSSTVKRSRIKNICYGARHFGSIEKFNSFFNTDKTLDELHEHNIYWNH